MIYLKELKAKSCYPCLLLIDKLLFNSSPAPMVLGRTHRVVSCELVCLSSLLLTVKEMSGNKNFLSVHL